MNTAKKKNFIISFLYFSSFVVIIFLTYKYLFYTVLPFLIALLTASLVQNSAVKLHKRIKLKKSLCALILIVELYVLILALLFSLISLLILSFDNIKNVIVDLITTIRESVLEWKTVFEKFLFENFNIKINIENIFSDSVPDIAGNLLGNVSSIFVFIFSQIPQIVITFIVTVVAGCYFAYDYDKFKKFILSLLTDETVLKLKKLRSIFKETIFKIVGGYLILMSISFAVLLIGFIVIGIKSAFYLALFISFVDLLPVLGTGTVLIPWAIFNLIRGRIFLGVGLIIIYIIVTIIRNFLEPNIIGKKLGISPLFMLIAIFVGYRLLGFIGLIAAPLLLIIVYEYYTTQKES